MKSAAYGILGVCLIVALWLANRMARRDGE